MDKAAPRVHPDIYGDEDGIPIISEGWDGIKINGRRNLRELKPEVVNEYQCGNFRVSCRCRVVTG